MSTVRFEPREGGGVILPTVESILLVKVTRGGEVVDTMKYLCIHSYPSHNFRVSESEV